MLETNRNLITAAGIPGWMLDQELKQLADWAQCHTGPHSVIVECGSFAGRSTYALAAHSHADSLIYCYDQFPNTVVSPTRNRQTLGQAIEETGLLRVGDQVDFLELFRSNLQEFSHVHAIPCVLPLTDFVPSSIDFFFFDLSHRNPVDRLTLKVFLPNFAPDAFICGHDYGFSFWPDVVQNAHWLAQLLDRPVLRGAGSLWYLKPRT